MSDTSEAGARPLLRPVTSRRDFAWPLTAALIIGLAYALHSGGYLARLEYLAAEARARVLTHEVDSDIVIVEIDSESLRRLSEWPWPRRHYARLLQHLERASPRSVFLDIDFSSHSNPEDDALFERELAEWSGAPVRLATHFEVNGDRLDPETLVRPLDRFARHTKEVAVTLVPSGDGLIRSMRSSWRSGDETIPSIFYDPATVAPGERIDIDFSISPSSFDSASFAALLNGEVDLASLRDKVVFVGATAVELNDIKTVPVYRALPGVVVQALATATVREGPLRTVSGWMYAVLLAVWSVPGGLLFARNAWRSNLLLLAAGAVLLAAASLYLYRFHRVDFEVVPFALVLVGLFAAVTLRSLDRESWRAVVFALRLRRRDALLKSIVESTTDAIACIDSSGTVRTANLATSRLFACSHDALIGGQIRRFVPDLWEPAEAAAPSPHGARECEAVTPDGRRIPVEVSLSRVQLDEDRLFTAIIRDVTERKAQQQRLEYQATHDALTGLPNRHALNAYLGSALPGVTEDRRVALLLLDLARFGEVNDTLGHDVGDELLAEAARRVVASFDGAAYVARIGADEFAVVLADISSQTVIDDAAVTLLQHLKAPFHVRGITIDLGATIGIALAPDHAYDAKELLRRADVAMYGAKRHGSPYEYYDRGHDGHAIRRLGLLSELRAALSTDQLALYYQPQVNLKTGLVEGVEALIRWHHPVLGNVRPDEFIGLAESSHLIRPVTQWTLHQALTDAIAWKRRGHELRVAVNLSAKMLRDAELPQQVERLLEAYSVAPTQLELEVTESATLEDPERAQQIVRDLHALGVGVSVDDYGTGFSSLGQLRDLKASSLKLDKSFVQDLESHERNRVIVESTVHLAHSLGLAIVAEGVETEWVKDYLATVGYDVGQGYWFSRPIPADECLAWVAAYDADARRRAG